MFENFYNSSMRQYILLMGDLFSRIQVKRKRSDGERLIKVPISYASKEHFMMKLNKINSVNSTENIAKIDTILPRINLHLVDMMYNSTYKTSILNRSSIKTKGTTNVSQYNPTPIKMIFELGIYTRTQDDMFQIVEQIVPYFQPHFNTTITELHGNEITFDRDVRIVLQSMVLDEQLEDDMTSRRRLEWSIMFEVNGWLYPPAADIKGIIKNIYLDFNAVQHELQDSYDQTIYTEQVNTHVLPEDATVDSWEGEYEQEYK